MVRLASEEGLVERWSVMEMLGGKAEDSKESAEPGAN